MSGFGTDAELMQKAASQVEEVRSSIDQSINQLQSQAEPVIANWKGQASQTFARLMEQFRQEANDITTKLGEIGQNIDSSGKTYTQQDEEQASEMSKIEGKLLG
ncbi:WXG100 family type VII secretion target [Saccharopolyspora lacisalsi]|uniref:ESAT-6-like protein n=1 Tax=Halosaccharopolyspora lacisalsi TaxID=1000566 RepID=A0A839DZP8_9PSEU|nr:WXG100 family type VII secretion target [Halosaccharopolyspora lacisalsi]MBA8826984.1 WXG100 family type VII secretion target [Halosaccharopolyspora lacisalsi]